jgi:hypothetical protein
MFGNLGSDEVKARCFALWKVLDKESYFGWGECGRRKSQWEGRIKKFLDVGSVITVFYVRMGLKGFTQV